MSAVWSTIAAASPSAPRGDPYTRLPILGGFDGLIRKLARQAMSGDGLFGKLLAPVFGEPSAGVGHL